MQRGPTLDGLGKYLRRVITESDATPVDVAQALRDTRADVLINYLPVGSEEGARFYAEQALQGRRRVRQLHPGLHRQRPGLAASFRGSRAADRRR